MTTSQGHPSAVGWDGVPPPMTHFRRVFSPSSETFVYEPIRTLAALGTPQRVLCIVRSNRRHRPFPADALLTLPDQPPGWRGPEAGRVPGWLWEAERPLWPLLRRWVARRLRRRPPAVLFAHFGPDGCLVAPVARALGIPLVTIFYGYDVSRLTHRPGYWQRSYARLFSQGTLFCGISRHVLARLEALGAPAGRCRHLPLGVDLARFAPAPVGAPADPRVVRVLHVGRLTAKKNPVKLIEAFASARAQVAPELDLRLTIAGAGGLEGACRSAVERLRLGAAVTLGGRVEHGAVAALFAAHDIYAQYCETAPDGDMEGLGVTFIEAAARGLPTVSTRHDGIPDVVRHGRTGLLSAEGDLAGFAGHLAALARDPQRRRAFGAAGRRHVERHFSLAHQLTRLRELAAEARTVAAADARARVAEG